MRRARHPDLTRIGTRGVWLTAFYGVLTVIVLWPVFSVTIPGRGDTLNHLARIHIITTLHASPALQKFYEVRWNFVPYLGMDAVVTLLAQVMPIYQAGRIFVAVCVIMPVVCAGALRAAAQGRVGVAPAAAFLLGYNYMLSWGFLNYLFSVGLALLLLAGWVASTGWPRWRRAAVFAVGLLLVYFSHVFACAAYCIAVAGLEIAAAVRARFRPWRRITADWLAAGSTAVPALCFAVSFRLAEAVPGVIMTRYGDVPAKLRAALSPILFPGAETATAATLATGCIVGFALWRAGLIRLSPALWPSLAATALAALCMPYVLFSTWGTDLRLPLVAAILGIAALTCARDGPRAMRPVLIAALLVLVAFKSVQTWETLRALDGQIGQVRRVVAALPRGNRLLVIEIDDPAAPAGIVPFTMSIHTPMVALIDRDAFLPNLFVGVTIVHVRDDMVPSSSANAPPIGMAALRDGLIRTDRSAGIHFFNFGARVYWLGWAEKFDDVLVLHFNNSVPDLPPILHKISSSAIADLYAVIRPAPAGSGSGTP